MCRERSVPTRAAGMGRRCAPDGRRGPHGAWPEFGLRWVPAKWGQAYQGPVARIKAQQAGTISHSVPRHGAHDKRSAKQARDASLFTHYVVSHPGAAHPRSKIARPLHHLKEEMSKSTTMQARTKFTKERRDDEKEYAVCVPNVTTPLTYINTECNSKAGGYYP